MVCAGVGLQQGKQSNATRGDLFVDPTVMCVGTYMAPQFTYLKRKRNGENKQLAMSVVCERDGRERENERERQGESYHQRLLRR